MGGSHVIILILGLIRLSALCSYKHEKLRLRRRWSIALQASLWFIAAACSMLELNIKIAADTGGGGSNGGGKSVDPYGPGNTIIPFEAVSLGIFFAACVLQFGLELFKFRKTVYVTLLYMLVPSTRTRCYSYKLVPSTRTHDTHNFETEIGTETETVTSKTSKILIGVAPPRCPHLSRWWDGASHT